MSIAVASVSGPCIPNVPTEPNFGSSPRPSAYVTWPARPAAFGYQKPTALSNRDWDVTSAPSIRFRATNGRKKPGAPDAYSMLEQYDQSDRAPCSKIAE